MGNRAFLLSKVCFPYHVRDLVAQCSHTRFHRGQSAASRYSWLQDYSHFLHFNFMKKII